MLEESPFKNDDIVEYLQTEIQEAGLSVEHLIPWLMKPPGISTFRVNTLKTTIGDVKYLFENTLSESLSQRGQVRTPKVWEAPTLGSDVLVIDSWSTKALEENEDDDTKSEVMVDASCGAAVLRGANIFAPGILAMSKGTQPGDKVKIYADIDGRCLQGTTTVYKGRKRFVGVGEVLMNRSDLFGTTEPPKGIAVTVTSTPSGCASVSIPPELGILQNLPSCVASYELGPVPGESVLDMCAAPGNKTTHLAALMCNQGLLIALDRTSKKAKQVEENCLKMSAQCLVFAFDSTKAAASNIDPQRTIQQGPPFNINAFDKVLLDAPCSALGQRPQLLNKISLSQLKSYPALQQRLFEAAVKLARPGGEIVYSTCSVTYKENEGLVEWALSKYGDELTLLPPRQRMAQMSPEGSGGLSEQVRTCVQRFGPPTHPEDQSWDSVGFFIARFKKVC